MPLNQSGFEPIIDLGEVVRANVRCQWKSIQLHLLADRMRSLVGVVTANGSAQEPFDLQMWMAVVSILYLWQQEGGGIEGKDSNARK